MEVSHTLTLNEAALQQLPDDKKPQFIFEWLRFLDKVLVAAHKSDIKSCQQKLVAQLISLLQESLGVPARRLLARCLATLFSVGDTFLLFDTVNKCNDIIKVKDDSPSYQPTRLAAICCLGSMYEKLGRMMGRSYEETVNTLVKSLKSAESQTRLEIMNTLEKICVGMGTAAPAALREVSRAARNALLSDRASPVRAAAAHALRHMLPLMKLTPADLDSIAAACLRAAHPSDYQLRRAIAELLGALVAATQAGEANNLNTKGKMGVQSVQQRKDQPKNIVSLDEALNLLMGAFLRGGTSFLKGEIIKSGSGVNREVRVCVTHAYVIFVENMGGVWLERNMSTFLSHVLDLVANPKAASSHVDAVYSRKCINYILRNTLGKMLGEKAQSSACREIIQIVIKQMNSIDFNPENAKDCNQETLFSQHLLVCALTEAGELALQLGTSVQNLVSDTSLNMIEAICTVLEHPCVAARLAAAWSLRCVCVALASQITPLLDKCVDALESASPTPHHISGEYLPTQVLEHPCVAARLAAAWSLRCVCVALESQITPLLDKCVDALESASPTPHHISGEYLPTQVLEHPCVAARLAAAWSLRCVCVALASQITPLLDKCVDALESASPTPHHISGEYLPTQVLEHPCVAARLAAAWSLRCVCVALASQITPLLDKCVDALESASPTPHHISGEYLPTQVLEHPCVAARLAAAWSLRCVCVALASQITPLLDKCVDALESASPTPHHISGEYLPTQVLEHPCVAARLAAAWSLRCVCVALASQITPLLDKCVDALESASPTPHHISGEYLPTQVLEHPCVAARLAAAWSLRCVCVALASQITPLLDKCVDALESASPTPHHISGYSAALSAILGSVRLSPLGVPHGRGKVAFNAAEQLLRSAGQSSRLTAARTNAGWLIVGAICTLGVPVVRGLLPRMLLLWRNSFPRSVKELESEKARGDAFTWQVTLEGRAGALSALHSLVVHCPSLVNNDDTAKRLLQPVDAAIAVLTNVSSIVRNYGGSLKAPAALLRLRVYRACCAGGAGGTSVAPALLRLLAQELAQAEPANTHTGLLRTSMHPRDTILLGEESWIYDTDHADIEEQLISPLSASGSGALEHDPCSLYNNSSGSQPLGVAVIDAAVLLFPQVFARAANKHRQQMLEHFVECIKMSKGSRQEAIQINIYTALLLSLKTLSELKSSLGQDNVKNTATELFVSGLTSSNTQVRVAAASCLSRLLPLLPAADCPPLTERLINLAKTSTNQTARAAAAFAVASSSAVLPVLRSELSKSKPNSAELQVWYLHALSVLVDTSGPMFRGHVETTLNLALKLLYTSPPYLEDLHRSIGRLLSALITVVGPELQAPAVGRFVCACAMLLESGGNRGGARAEALACLQQVHMFTGEHKHLHYLLPALCRDLSNPELAVRRAALCCLRQLSQKEASEVCKLALTARGHVPPRPYCGVVITDTGLPGALFAYLDIERDPTAISYAKDTLTCCLLSSVAEGSVRDWLALAKRVLTVRTEDSNKQESEEGEADDDQVEFHAEAPSSHPAVQARWPTRVFAMECIQKIMSACEATGESAHFDLIKAKEKLKDDPNGDFLSLHLQELVRMAFVAATSSSSPLRLCGINTLQIIIRQFANAAEPDFPGHVLLEQCQAQVGAAIRPAFSSDTMSHVTACACDVCSAWIGCGVARDMSDLRRVHQLLVSSLDKLNTKGNTTLIYNESMATLEKLSILKAWAEVYIVAMVKNGSAPGSYVKQLDSKPISNRAELAKWRNKLLLSDNQIDNANLETDEDQAEYGEFESKGESLLKLVEPELENLGDNWLAALRDHALLSLPPEFNSQLPHGGGAFYSGETVEASRPHYTGAWPSLLYAASLRFNANINEPHTVNETSEEVDNRPIRTENGNCEFFEPTDERFHLLFGICMEALCAQRDMSVENTISVLLSLVTLLDAPENRARLLKDRALAIELCQIIHRCGLTQSSIEALLLIADVLRLVITGAREQLEANMQAKIKELAPNEASDGTIPQSVLEVVHTLGEGGPTGDLPPGKSLVFAALEVCVCLLVRRLPSLNPLKHSGAVGVIGSVRGFGTSGDTLLLSSLQAMCELPGLCSAQGALSVLPTMVHLALEILSHCKGEPIVREAGVLLLQAVGTCKLMRVISEAREAHATLMQSAANTLLERVKSDEESQRIDAVSGAQGLAAVLRCTEPCAALHYPCINHFRQCLDTEDNEIFASCCAVLRTVWSPRAARPPAAWWARALAPRVAARALRCRAPRDPADTKAGVAAVGALDELINHAPDDARIQLLWLLVPIVISYLREGVDLGRAPPHVRALHEFALQWLTKIGPKYPQEFKSMMQQSSELRNKLESAVKAKQNLPRNGRSAQRPLFEAPPARPTIQLKTDFSDFR